MFYCDLHNIIMPFLGSKLKLGKIQAKDSQ